MAHGKKRTMRPVTASELAQMGMCERRIVFEHCHGKRSTVSQSAARQRGVLEHERFYQEALQALNKKGRCSIATQFYGDGPEIVSLRLLRDRVLRKSVRGCWLIGGYDRVVRTICTVLVRRAWLQPLVCTLMRPIALVVGRVLWRKKDDHER